MKVIIFNLFLFALFGFAHKGNGLINWDTDEGQADVALEFINSYISFSVNHNEESNYLQWIKDNSLLTESFKTQYQSLMEDAKRKDPEMGLGFDPILNAQDFPESGFILDSYDRELGRVILKGKGWENFRVNVKIVFEGNKWLVGGAGIINIPDDWKL